METAIDVNTLNAIYQLLESRPATNSAEYADVSFIEAEGAFFSDYLAVLGTATITDLRVTNSITLAKITGLNGSVDLAGNLNISGDLTVAGNVNILGELTAPTASFGALLAQRLEVNEAKIDQLTTNQLIIAASTSEESSSATSEVATAAASIRTNATAGKAVLPAGLTEYTIYNPRVDADSLVYVTPTGDPRNQVLYVKSKQAGEWFKVAINQPLPYDLEFNWWIIRLE